MNAIINYDYSNYINKFHLNQYILIVELYNNAIMDPDLINNTRLLIYQSSEEFTFMDKNKHLASHHPVYMTYQ